MCYFSIIILSKRRWIHQK